MPIVCPKCGAVSPDNQTACMHCGKKFRKSAGIGMIFVSLFDWALRWFGRLAIAVTIIGGITWWIYNQNLPQGKEGEKKKGGEMFKVRQSKSKQGDEGEAAGAEGEEGAEEDAKAKGAEPDTKLIETLKMRLEPAHLREGYQAEVYLLNGEAFKGKIFKVSEYHISLAIGSQLRGFYPDDIRLIVQGYPVELAQSERAKCLARLRAACFMRPAVGDQPKRLSVRVNNASTYAFRGTVTLKAPDAAPDAEGIKVDVSQGIGVPAGKFVNVDIPVGDEVTVPKFTPAFEGEFCDTVEVKPVEKTVLEKAPVVEQAE